MPALLSSSRPHRRRHHQGATGGDPVDASLLAGSSHPDADENQHGRGRQADHEGELRRGSAGPVLQKRNNGLHVNPHVSNPAGRERNPPLPLASTLAPPKRARASSTQIRKQFPRPDARDPSRASPRLIYSSNAMCITGSTATWYQLFPGRPDQGLRCSPQVSASNSPTRAAIRRLPRLSPAASRT